VIPVQDGGVDFLTNQPVEGELLADRLKRGPLPAAEAVRCAIAVGGVLKRAHAEGKVHGRISPYSIAITAAGAVRVLRPPHSPESRSAAYRSPEQIRGAAPDARSDIFAFGALLYELVSGTRAFSGMGEELFREILHAPAPRFGGNDPLDTAIDAVIRGCLEKEPAHRRQRIQNAVIELKMAAGTARAAEVARIARLRPPKASVPEAPPAPAARVEPVLAPPARRFPWRGMAGVAVLIAAAGIAAAAYSYWRPRNSKPVLTFHIAQPENTTYAGPPAISPDGRYVVLPALRPDGKRMLWLQPLDALSATLIPGTEGAAEPFWSPDSRQIGFFAAGSLRRVPRDGGTVETICAAESTPGGAAWNSDGTILFAPGFHGGLYLVAASGGNPEPLLQPSAARFESAFLWPQFLPDGKHFLFFVLSQSPETAGVYAGTASPAEYHLVLASQTNAVYAAAEEGTSRRAGYLLFIHDHTLTAQAFNPARVAVEGDPVPLAEHVAAMESISFAPLSVSGNSTLVYQALDRPARRLMWMDRAGHPVAVVPEPGEWGPPRIAPDGTRAVSARLSADRQTAHLWILDAAGNATQFTDTAMHEGSPVWSPDGSRIAFFMYSRGDTNFDIYSKAINGSRIDLLFHSDAPKYPSDWSHDGRYLFYSTLAPGTKADIWSASIADRRSGPILNTIAMEQYAALSPDGKWLAYQSDESGRTEVYVQAFDGIGAGTRRRWQVSAAGGGIPRWRADGQELFYLTSAGEIMSVTAHPDAGTFAFDPPHTLFGTRALPKLWNLYDAAPDGQRFLVNVPFELSPSATIAAVTNWTARLRE